MTYILTLNVFRKNISIELFHVLGFSRAGIVYIIEQQQHTIIKRWMDTATTTRHGVNYRHSIECEFKTHTRSVAWSCDALSLLERLTCILIVRRLVRERELVEREEKVTCS